ncbi:nucleotidyltransferase family protein [[Limnothrix rosea] IAM M-220]|uniref:nucleotidyltransferase family protein n=1 Tax=[Limnothrix rosea] IAM M-220 TaxID=454133 RepID=UPI000A00F0F7|nr:nucleotidyltransferase domain-containing protein [[Limnothrix rosea] IAM M-220]
MELIKANQISLDSTQLYERLATSKDLISDFCRNWQITQLAIFGSVLRNDFRSDSDVDFLIVLSDNTHLSFSEFLDLEEQLSNLVKRDVDIIFVNDLERSENWIRRKHILETATVIYES